MPSGRLGGLSYSAMVIIFQQFLEQIYFVTLLEKNLWTLMSEAYLDPSETSTIVYLYENSYWLLAVYYVRKKAPSQMFDWVLNTPLYV